MQTDIKMQEYDGEERRALNMIWTAAKDHSFRPEFMAFDRYGRADLYLNSIIGYVHRWYDGGKVSEMFGAFQGTALQDIYDTIFWLGLECGAYEKERAGNTGPRYWRNPNGRLRKSWSSPFRRAGAGWFWERSPG